MRLLRDVDRVFAGTAIALSIISIIAMASAGSALNPGLTIRHTVWVVVGAIVCLGVSHTNYRRWAGLSELAYGVSLLALMLVHVVGTMRLGATRWLSVFGLSLQPSELAKLTTIWLLARYFAGQPRPVTLRQVLWSLALAGPPIALIFLQPDLGSATIIGAAWLGMVWAAGASRRTLIAVLGTLAALSLPAWHLLKDYQRDRLLAFINPHADPLGTGFSIIQSTIAIGSGRLLGRGWRAGTQNQLNFLPESHSDFIFSVVGEEWGLVGSVAIIGLFGLLLSRTLRIAMDASDPQGRLLAVGIFSWLAYQTLVNIGMVMGLLPVVGVPLPLLSYGGSSMVTIWFSLGLLHSIQRTERLE